MNLLYAALLIPGLCIALAGCREQTPIRLVADSSIPASAVVRGAVGLNVKVLAVIDEFAQQPHLVDYSPVYLLYIKKDSVGGASVTICTSSSEMFLYASRPSSYMLYKQKVFFLLNGDENIFDLSDDFNKRIRQLTDSTLAINSGSEVRRRYIDRQIWKIRSADGVCQVDKQVRTAPQIPADPLIPPPPIKLMAAPK